jgi:hypothetical protein
MKRRLWCSVAVAMVVGCGGSVAPSSDPLSDDFDPNTQPGVKGRVGLISFSGPNACADLKAHLEDRAVLQMRVSLASSKRSAMQSWDSYHSPFGYNTPSGGGGMDAGVASSGGGGSGGSGGAGAAAPSAPTAYTTTNTQLKSVDEPDFVKNDGTRIFVLSGRTLYATVSWPAAALARAGSLAIDGTPREMFLDGARLLVFSDVLDASVPNLPSWCASGGCGGWYHNATKVTFVDVADLSHLRVTKEYVVPGDYQTARRVGSTVRLVVTGQVEVSVNTWIGWDVISAAPTKRALSAKFEELARKNETALRGRTLEQWIPSIRAVGESAGPAPLDCSQVAAPDTSAELGIASIVTLNLDAPEQLSRTSLLAQATEVYASPEALYLAQPHWWWSTLTPRPSTTYLHKFALGATRVAWVGSGRVDGTLVDQFAMDEHQGYLRVATTIDTPVRPAAGASWWTTLRTNRVTVFSEQEGALVVTGQSADIGQNERIMSARFLGDKGYVVTFRQTDPLFTFDLSDPTQPRLVGELKVPGFSSYLHPLDATHLLTIGTYIPETPSDWRERALQLSIFDVSDLSNPRQTFTQEVGHAYSWSEAQWEHKAFNYFPERGLLAIPFFDYSYSYDAGSYWASYVSDLRVFKVDAGAGFTSLGSLDMRDVLMRANATPYDCWYWGWQPMVRRSVMADDYVYAISSGGIRVANVADLSKPVATVAFDYDAP